MARQALGRREPGAASAVRRLARSLRATEGLSQHPEVKAMSRILEQAPEEQLGGVLEKFIPILRAIARTPRERKRLIVCVEDDAVVQALVQERLASPSRDIVMAGSIAAARQTLSEREVSLVLLDLGLPDGDGRDLLLELREQEDTREIPVIVLSAEHAQQPKTECFALGANDYILKPFDPVTLSTLVAAELHRSAERSRRSSLDSLTGIPNRNAFTNAFARASQLAGRSGQPLTLGLLDVDRFKSINDLYGHAAGDDALCRLASVVSRSLRSSDLLARWGGDEFAILLPQTGLQDSQRMLEKTLEEFRLRQFTAPNGETFQVSFSAGLVAVHGDETLEEAILEADQLLYAGKVSGRSKVASALNQPLCPKPSILVVEDDLFTASLLRQYLEQRGFDVEHVLEGSKVLETATAKSFSVILLDVLMRDIDGFEVLRRLRANAALREVPVVMLTSQGQSEDVLKGFELGANDYMVKPFSPPELLARTSRLLAKVAH